VIQRLVVSNRTLGVVVNGKFYATLTDHLGSIIAVLDGERQVITRSYDLWGNKKVQVSAGYEELEKLIAWSFAGLIEPPQLSGKGLYWSKSRVYSSDLKHWLSIDPAVLYDPEKLITSTKDWNGMLYCNGDPVNFVDPSGQNSVFLGGAGTEFETAKYSNLIVNKMRSAGVADPVFIQNSTFLSKAGNVLATLAMRESPLHSNSSLFNSFINPVINASNTNGGQRNIIGYSYGSVTGAQAALRMANSGTKVDNLVLIGSPISTSSELYKSLINNSNIGNVQRFDISNDPFSNGIDLGNIFNMNNHFHYDNNGSGQQDALINQFNF
jgi:RHS repeat-associated protein